MSSTTSKRFGIIVFTALLFGCPPPSADATVDATLEADALVIEGNADEEQYWGGTLTVDAAPAAEYMLFTSPTRPTSLAGLSDLDLGTCTPSTCNAPGLGQFMERVKLDASGPVKLAGGGDGAPKSRLFFVLIRRGASTVAPLKIGGSISIEGNAGCGGSNPDPPSLTTSSLSGAPPVTASPAGGSDAGPEAEASTRPAPSCAALKTQLDACPNISQPSKDLFATFCAGISEGCRGCLDGALCGVTEPCDPLCGK